MLLVYNFMFITLNVLPTKPSHYRKTTFTNV